MRLHVVGEPPRAPDPILPFRHTPYPSPAVPGTWPADSPWPVPGPIEVGDDPDEPRNGDLIVLNTSSTTTWPLAA